MNTEAFSRSIGQLGMFLLLATAVVFALLAGLLVVGRLASAGIRVVQRQIRGTAELYSAASYVVTDRSAPVRAWRRQLQEYQVWLESLGYSALAFYINQTAAKAGFINFHTTFVSPDRRTIFCVSFITTDRYIPYLGIRWPLPRLTGMRSMGWEAQTRLSSGTLVATVGNYYHCSWPPFYDVQDGSVAATAEGGCEIHARAVEKHLVKGDSVIPWKDREDFMQFNFDQHRILSQRMTEKFEKLAEKLESASEEGVD